MNQLGDISGGNAQRFQSLALAFSQVSSAGKLQGQDLLQMINAGFNPLESIAKRTGKSVGYWKEQMSKGKVTVKMVEQAMRDATSEGGRFYKMMEKQSKTALGQWSTFQDNLNMVLAEFGKIILPIAIDALAKLSETLEWINSLSPATKKLVLIVAAFAAGLGPLLIILGSVTTAVLSLNAGLGTLAVMLKMTKLATLGWGAGWIAGIWGLIKGIQLLIELLKNLKSRLAAIDGRKIGNINLDNQQNLDYLSGEYARIGAKAFKKKYNKETVKAVEQNNKNITNTNNTTNNTTNNNYYAGANPRNAQYAT
jgi:tape measure domain-containing protein